MLRLSWTIAQRSAGGKHAEGVPHTRELLTRTRRSITDIALSCGFSSSQHFSTVFKAQEGCTPTDFRNSRR
jgi:AraC-like DNA-binding protein